MIEFRDIDKSFIGADGRETIALQGLDLTVATGEVHCLIGTSGCGKTTTLRLVNRLETATRGQVLVDGEDIAAVDVYRLRRGIGYVTQSGGLFPHLTVHRNIGILCQSEGHSSAAIETRVHELLELVNLPRAQFAGRYPEELSGGQRQRVGIARALALDPRYLLMDEPFGSLDPITRQQLHAELRPLFAKLHKTVLLVTHDLDEAFELGHRVSVMDQGRVLQTGTRDDLCSRPASRFVADFVAGHTVPHG